MISTGLQHAGLAQVIFGCVLAVAWVVARFRGNTQLAAWLDVISDLCFVAGEEMYALGSFLQGDWPGGLFNAAIGVVIAWFGWRRYRRNRKRAPLLLGAKSRAIRDALVKRAREAATPRPVLRQVPQGGTPW